MVTMCELFQHGQRDGVLDSERASKWYVEFRRELLSVAQISGGVGVLVFAFGGVETESSTLRVKIEAQTFRFCFCLWLL